MRAAANACLDVIVECDRVTPNEARTAEDTKNNDEFKSNSSEGAQPSQSGGLGRLGLEVCRRRFRAHNKEWLASAAKDDYSYGRGAYGGASSAPYGAVHSLAYALRLFVLFFRVCAILCMITEVNVLSEKRVINFSLTPSLLVARADIPFRRRLAQRLLARLARSSLVVESRAWRDGVRLA